MNGQLMAGIGAAALAAVLIAGGITLICRRCAAKETDAVDGGVVKRYQADAPKVIESTEIVEFRAVSSLLSAFDDGGLGHRVYTLEAKLADGMVRASYQWRGQGGSDKGEFTAGADFMTRLQEITAAHNLAEKNGFYHSVSGLPNMYGDSLYVLYASGEWIDVYDNQDGFLPMEAVQALVELFGAATKLDAEK